MNWGRFSELLEFSRKLEQLGKASPIHRAYKLPVGLLDPAKPPYDALDWVKRPFAERARMVCEAWAIQGYGAPVAIYVVYALKIALFVGGWLGGCAIAGLAPSNIAAWWLTPLAFQKAIAWSMLFEGVGLGCGSGPLTGRYLPPIGGLLYWLRPGTTKLAMFPRAPIVGGIRRTWIDVALYLGVLAILGYLVVGPALDRGWFALAVGAFAALAICDRTMLLVFRGEHYATTLLCMAITPDWIAGAMAVQLALWLWAGISKLNHHFPAVVCVMISNSPFVRFAALRRMVYRSYPDDLRPSRIAVAMAHAGTALELGVPIVLVVTHGSHTGLVVGLVMAFGLHAFITSCVPMGVPLEWNVMVVYGALALFWAHPAIGLADLAPPLAIVLPVLLVIVPLAGNRWPDQISFLLAMRYYAGNWAYGVWLFRGDSYRKLAALKTSAPWIYDQLAHFYEPGVAVGLVGKVMGFRMMHLHGRALPVLVPRAIDGPLSDYEYLDGEMVAGLVLGWNFGDGHLHREPLLDAVQTQCKFLPGELRCVFVESQPLGGDSLAYRIVDAASGERERGELLVADLRARQPWSHV